MKASGGTLLMAGLLLGLAAGLLYGWVVQPVRLTDTAPSALRSDFQDEYVGLIAAAYAATGDLPRARARLELLPEAGDPDHVAALAQSWLAAGRPEREILALAGLASDLKGRPSPTAPSPSTVVPATALPTARPTRPPPTPFPTPTPGAAFRLAERALVCDDPAEEPRLQVVVRDAAGRGVPNVLVRVIWDAGQDQFYTGLKPELGLGFGDFTIEPGVEYAVQLAESDTIASGIRSEVCTEGPAEGHIGSWRLTFEQPSTP